jgi:hypothetical protein
VRLIPAPAAGFSILSRAKGQEPTEPADPNAQFAEGDGVSAEVNYRALAALPSVRERDAAIERRAHAADTYGAGGRGYACLYLSILESGQGPGSLPLGVEGSMERTRHVLARVVFEWPVDAPTSEPREKASERAGTPAPEEP